MLCIAIEPIMLSVVMPRVIIRIVVAPIFAPCEQALAPKNGMDNNHGDHSIHT
jgi:hypothetical protein